MARNALRRAGFALAAAGGVVLLAGAALAAESVRTRAAAHDGFGRVVFDWPAPVAFDVTSEDGAVRITFGRALRTSFGAVRRNLGAYVRDVRLDGGGRTVILEVSRDFELRAFSSAASVVVDLLDGAARDTAAARPAGVPRVAVRVGDHRGYSRVVFDWRWPVEYKVSRTGGEVKIRFDRAADIDFAALNASPPRHVRTGRSEIVGKRTNVTLAIDPAGRLRHFRSGTRVVLDVLVAQARPQARPGPDAPAPAARTAPAPGEAPGDTAAKEPVAVAVAPPGPPTTRPIADTAPATPTPAPGEAMRVAAGPGTPPPAAQVPDPGAAAGTADETPAPRPVSLVGAGASPAPTRAARPEAAAAPDRSAARVALGPPQMAVVVETRRDRVDLIFSPGKRIPSAAFIRGGHLWVVFPGAYKVDLEPLRAAGAPAYESVAQIPHAAATVLRFKLHVGFSAAVRQRGRAWVVHVSQRPQPPAVIELRVLKEGARENRVKLPLDNVGKAIELHDPDDGATLIVVPVAASGAGVAPGYSSPGFDLIATVQGIAVRIAADGVNVATSSAGVEIASADDGDPATRAARLAALRADPDIALFDLAVWRRGGADEFAENRRVLQLAAATAPTHRRTRSRISLARFLFSHGYFVETLGVLDVLVAEEARAAEDLSLRAIRAVSQLMLDRIAEAAAVLDNPALDAYDDIALWRGVLAMRQGDLEAAALYFARAGSMWLHDLMPHLSSKIGLVAAEAAIEARDLAAATGYLDAIRTSRPQPDVADRERYLRGRLFYAAGNQEEALKQWEGMPIGSDRLARAGTRFHRAMMMFETGQITASEAIERLDTLRFAWRGDAFELNLLQQLAQLYVGEKQYRNALAAMKQAVTHFAGNRIAARLPGRMNELFANIFLRGAGDELPPVKALTLYYEFRELTPVGAAGDTVIQGLADRLVSVDLLKRAGELLKHQVTYRLKGVDKARVGTRLAVIRLMDRKPKAALEALESTEIATLPDQLVTQRRHLMARALTDLGRDTEALMLISRDSSVDAELLRADIGWDTRDWSMSAAATRRVLIRTPNEAPLSRFASGQILRLAVALALAHDRVALKQVRARHAEAMKGTADNQAFEMITAAVNRGELDFRELPAAVAQVASFEAFMAGYRERLRKENLSAIN